MRWMEGVRGLPRDLWILFLTTLINRAGTMVLPFLVLYLTRELGLSISQAGLIMALYGAGAMVTAPFSGMLCDRFGADRILKISLLFSSVALCAFPLVKGFCPVVAMTLLVSVTSEMFRPAAVTLVTATVAPEQRKMAFAFFRQAINLGMSIGPVLGGFLAGISFFYIFLIDGLTSLAGGIVAAMFFKTNHAKSAAANSPRGENAVPAYKDSVFLYFLIALIPVLITFFQHISTLPIYMVQDLKLSEAMYGATFTINTALVILLEVPLNMATADWSFRRSLSFGCLLVGIGFGALLLAKGIWSVTATIVLWTFGEMILFPSSSAYVAEIAPQKRQGQYMGFYTMAFSFAFAVGPWLGSLLYDRLGSNTLWVAMLVLAILSAVLMLRLPVPESAVSQR